MNEGTALLYALGKGDMIGGSAVEGNEGNHSLDFAGVPNGLLRGVQGPYDD